MAHQQQRQRGRGGTGRNVQAFEALFEPQDDETPRRQTGSSGSAGGSAGRRRSGRGTELVRGFRLREEAEQRPPGAAGARAGSGPSPRSDQAQLQEMFGSSLPADLIADVYGACGGDLAAATESLLSMSFGGAGGRAAPGATEAAAAEQDRQSAGTSDGVALAAAGEPCWWEELPRECRELVFGRLTLREQAVAARTCREWAAHVRAQRAGLRAVRVPKDVTHTALRGLVAAFGAAEEVDLR